MLQWFSEAAIGLIELAVFLGAILFCVRLFERGKVTRKLRKLIRTMGPRELEEFKKHLADPREPDAPEGLMTAEEAKRFKAAARARHRFGSLCFDLDMPESVVRVAACRMLDVRQAT